ncbi:multicopper oxidase domain-containing protein [Micromonospora coxensis]|uniref:multicopper oxidase domain-containing protein n=1 Tax=Micromonospora coxensis TaxID=356852 RepID=UPI0034195015
MRRPLIITTAVVSAVVLAGGAFGLGAAVDGGADRHGAAHAGAEPAAHDEDDPNLGTEDGHDHGGHAGSTGTPASYDPAAEPGPGFKARDAGLPPAPPGREHRVTLTVTEQVVEVAPGVRQRAWTYNGTLPGPTLRGKVGDTFVVTLVNSGSTGHSIDFHASQVAPDTAMRTIQPGESLTYTFTAERAGAFMYHCGSAPALHHIGNGMFGAVVVDPPNLPAVDAEYLVVQSDLALGAQDGLAKLGKLYRAEYDAIAFNGYAGQYRFAPVKAVAGKRVRIWVVDAGPSAPSAFHVVGTVFDTVYKDGGYVLRPGDPDRGGAQVLDLAPSQGGFVEFAFTEPGEYPMVSHRFADATRGATGLFTVTAA